MSNTRNKLPSRLVRKLGSTQHRSVNKNSSEDIVFSKNLYDAASMEQKQLLSNFDNDNNNKIKVPIYQKDFKYGTFRITEPGYYILKEHIVFDPINLFPTPEQYNTYPIGKEGPYHLGFFAAITIECADVVLNLNGFSIIQSKRHNLLQRFFSVIELANSPFIPKQGPHSFIQNYKPATRCLIANGRLEESSHHGIHGNGNKDIVIHNLKINNYEVAGIALNGARNSIISHCKMNGKNDNINVLSCFSQAIFCARALEQSTLTHNQQYINLDKDIQQAYREIIQNTKQSTYFENKTSKYDGNMYGIVLHVKGVVINEFLSSRENKHGNENILLFKNEIDKVESHPVEILGLPVERNVNNFGSAYGTKRMVGSFGDVFDVEKVMDSDRKYIGNSLSEAQLFLSALLPKKGTANIAPDVVEWARSGSTLPDHWKFVPEGDSMGHFMKGNIGLFISGGKNIKVEELEIKNVEIHGDDIGNSPLLNDNERYFQGANAYGVLMTASENVELKNVNVLEIKTHHPKGIAKKIERLN